MSEPTRRCSIVLAIVSLSLAQLGCGAAGESTPSVTNPPSNTATSGKLVVLVQPRGNGRDADGFNAALDGTPARTVADDPTTVTYDSLSPGDHTVRIAGIAPHCSASADSITHTTKAGATDTVTVGVACLGGFAYLQVIDTARYDIAYLTEDGRTIQLTNGPDLKFIDSWSPDGTRLLYTQFENGHFHLHTVRADGTDPKTITSGTGYEYGAQWSPDGTHIAYEQTGSGAYIAISDADGANAHPLVGTSSATEYDPTWSIDGSRLYFACDRFQRAYDLCTAALDGSDLRAIQFASVDSILTSCTPVCSATMMHFATAPGGSRIAFEVLSANAPQRIWSASLDGTSAVPLSGNTISFAGKWSPSGDRLLLNVTDGTDRFALATVKADGSSYRQITGYDDFIQQGDWSPDGTTIAYVDVKVGQIGVMNADGTDRQLITRGMLNVLPVWNPKTRVPGPLSSDRARTSSPRLEQLPVLPRLRPEVLRRRLESQHRLPSE
jgi:Tol biopolymer transport system component